MPGWLTRLVPVRPTRASDTAGAQSKSFNPERVVAVCAVTLSILVVASAGLVVFNLRNRVISENEQALSNSALIVAKQIAQVFTAVEDLQKDLNEQISRLPGI